MMTRILSLIGWLGTAIVAVAMAVSYTPALNNYSQYARPLALAGLICVLAYTAGQWREISQLFARRQTRYGTLMGVSNLVFLGVLVAVNYIGARQNKRWDLTANKQFSLSDQSRNVIAKLDAPLQILVFDKETEFPRFQDKLKGYQYLSKQVSAEYVDVDKKPAAAKQN